MAVYQNVWGWGECDSIGLGVWPEQWDFKSPSGNLPGGPVVKTPPSASGFAGCGVGVISSRGPKIPHALLLSQKENRKVNKAFPDDAAVHPELGAAALVQ